MSEHYTVIPRNSALQLARPCYNAVFLGDLGKGRKAGKIIYIQEHVVGINIKLKFQSFRHVPDSTKQLSPLK